MVWTVGLINLKVILSISLIMHLGVLPGCALIEERQETKRLEEQVKEIREKKTRYVKAESLYRQGEYAQAKSLYEELLDSYPTFLPARYRLGNIAFREGKLIEAANYFEHVVKRAPKHSKAHYNLAMIRILQSENNLKNYAATAPANTDLSPILIFLQNIDSFSGALQSKHTKSESVNDDAQIKEVP